MPKEMNFYSRSTEYGWLSNFWRSPQIMLDGIEYPTNEHYYQAQKANNIEIKKWIASATSPYLAMKAGRSLREKEFVVNWDTVKIDIMLTGLRAKFSQNSELRQKLIDTGDSVLCEDSPTDLFWGKKGQNMLGKLLMQVREEMRGLCSK